jgi:hypothetical protein
MKTKLAVAALLLMIGVAQVRASENGPSLKISREEGSGIFLVKYLGIQTGDVKLTIKDATGGILLNESIKEVKGFSLPVNLEGVGEGVYTVEVGNKSFQEVGTIDYTNQTPATYTHVSQVGDNRYMLSVAHAGTESVRIKILNDNGLPVYDKEVLVRGNFASVYDLPNIVGMPSFEVTAVSSK